MTTLPPLSIPNAGGAPPPLASPPLVRPQPVYPDGGTPASATASPRRVHSLARGRPLRAQTTQGRTLQDVIKAARAKSQYEGSPNSPALASPRLNTGSQSAWDGSRRAYFSTPDMDDETAHEAFHKANNPRLRDMEKREAKALKSVDSARIFQDPEAVDLPANNEDRKPFIDGSAAVSDEPEEMNDIMMSDAFPIRPPVSSFLPRTATTISHPSLLHGVAAVAPSTHHPPSAGDSASLHSSRSGGFSNADQSMYTAREDLGASAILETPASRHSHEVPVSRHGHEIPASRRSHEIPASRHSHEGVADRILASHSGPSDVTSIFTPTRDAATTDQTSIPGSTSTKGHLPPFRAQDAAPSGGATFGRQVQRASPCCDLASQFADVEIAQASAMTGGLPVSVTKGLHALRIDEIPRSAPITTIGVSEPAAPGHGPICSMMSTSATTVDDPSGVSLPPSAGSSVDSLSSLPPFHHAPHVNGHTNLVA